MSTVNTTYESATKEAELTYKSLAQNFEHRYKLNSKGNKEQFLAVWGTVKTIDKKNRVDGVKLMKKVAEYSIKLDTARREYGSVLNLVEAYALLPDRYVNLSLITWDSLKAILRLVKKVEKHYDSDLTKLEELSSVYTKGMSAFRYNNLLVVTLKELNKELPTPEKSVDYDVVTKQVEKLSVTEQKKLFQALSRQLGYEFSEAEETEAAV